MSRPRCRCCEYRRGQPATYLKPEVKVEPESPFIKAAWEGDVSLVRSLLKGFPGAIDVNHTATIMYVRKNQRIDRTVYQHSHDCTALHAAVCNGHLEVVQLLLESGASVNIPNCQHSTPLHEATKQNNLEMVKALHKHGALINVVNENRLSPLCIALANNHTDTVRYFLEAGASTLSPNPTGLSAMHVAAASGHLEGIKLLLSYGASPMFSEPSSSEGYIPCPLYIAAVRQYLDVVTELSAHPECPPSCKADALLILGLQKISFFLKKLLKADALLVPGSQKISFLLKTEQDRKQLEEAKELWEQALKIREEYQLTPKFLPPMPAYNDAVEIQTLDDLKQLFGSESIKTVLFQCLIIRERCLGFKCIPRSDGRKNREILFNELMSAFYSHRDNKNEHYERLVLKSFESMEKIITHPANIWVSACDQLLKCFVAVNALLSILHRFVLRLLKGGLSPQFEKHISWTLKILEHLQLKWTEASCGDAGIIGSFIKHQGATYLNILFLFLHWLLHSSLSTEREEDEVVGSDECEALGREFVGKHLDISPMDEHTLLNVALVGGRARVLSGSTFPVLIVALLRWGANAVINVPDLSGQRPLHLAAKLDNRIIISHLLDYGAHLDAVNAKGRAFYEVLKTFPTANPLPLVCQVSRKIVSEGIPYQNLDLPRHVKEFISLHDPTPRDQ